MWKSGHCILTFPNSTVGLADSAGTVTSSYSYDAFGNLDNSIDPMSIQTSYLYTGQQFDPVYTEMYSLRARYYDPSIGRFMTRDTWAYDYANPVELNRYASAANNPTTLADPSGLATSAITYEGKSGRDTLLANLTLPVLAVSISTAFLYLAYWLGKNIPFNELFGDGTGSQGNDGKRFQ